MSVTTLAGRDTEMRYLEIDLDPASDAPLPWWARLLASVAPAANPDLDSLYPRARSWWLEITDTGAPVREIGFDSERNPIVLGPLGRNFGFLIDSSDDWSSSDADSLIAAERFDATWEALLPHFAHIASD